MPGLIMAGMVLWPIVIISLAINGSFDVPANSPALPTLIAIAVPVLLFLIAAALLPGLRRWALALDPVLLAEFQAWRIVGGLFIVLMMFGHLPGFFAWPAGLGDVAVGVAAPFVAMGLRRNPDFLATGKYRLFNFLGLLDFAVAVSLGVASRNHIPGLVETVTTSSMGQVPLVLIPALVVPAFIILHIIALMQSWAAARALRQKR